MRVALVDVNYKANSTGKLVHDLHQGLLQQGIPAIACYGRGKPISADSVYRIAYGWETLLHVLLARFTGLNGVFSILSTRRLLRRLDAFRPDVVHLHELHGYYVNVFEVMEYLKAHDIRTIWTFHCEYMYTGKCGHAYSCERWRDACGKCPQLRRYPKSLLIDFTAWMLQRKKRAFRGFSRLQITAPSDWLSNRIRQSFLGTIPVQTVHNGIDLDVFRPRDANELRERHGLKGRFVALAVATDLMTVEKGGHWILELARRFHDRPISFVLVGAAEKQVAAAGLDNVVAVPRTRDQAELAAYYSLAGVTLLTSRKETFSLVCAESLACGTPLIGFEAGAPEEVAPPGYGMFVSYGDLTALAALLERRIAGTLPMRSGADCSAFAAARYDKHRMLNNYLHLYSSPA